MLKQTWLLRTFAAIFGMFVTQTAFAEVTTELRRGESDEYSYRFTDENMLGTTLNQVGDMYRFRPASARVLLLRPRTSLVQEIFKSVEGL